MKLFDIVTGRVYRDNQVSRVVFSEPMERLKEQQNLQGFLNDYALALAMTVDTLVKSIAGEKTKIREYALIGKKVERESLARLAAFCAWWLENRTLEDHPEIVANERGELDDTGRAMVRDMQTVRESMYPASDPVVVAAIERSAAADNVEALPEGAEINSAAYTQDLVDIIDSLLGVSRAGYPNREMMLRAISLTGAFVSCRELVASSLQVLSGAEE